MYTFDVYMVLISDCDVVSLRRILLLHKVNEIKMLHLNAFAIFSEISVNLHKYTLHDVV